MMPGLWTCLKCGCEAIVADLRFCPNCQADREEEPSAGTSFLTSGSKPDSSGSSTGTDPQSPVPDAENPSDLLPQASQPVPSSASLTDGSTQETSSDPASPPDSSAESPEEPESSQDQVSEQN